ncbi:MAG: YccS family putative transporter [Cardiobacteriaceae bacterium]|nr:YccS family putative transporter [Cardiobacteriaceae bacterium]
MKKLFLNANIISTLPVFISVSIAALFIWWFNTPNLAIPLILGVIAGGLVDLDNRLRERIKDLGIILTIFALSSIAVQLTLSHNVLYIATMMLLTFTFTFMGAVSLRYRTIAFGALVVAIYTTLAHSIDLPWYSTPLLILLGTLLYGACTLVVQITFPHRQVQENMAIAYAALGDYIDAKACFFDPDDDNIPRRQTRLALCNTSLIQAFNNCRNTLFYRLRGQHRHPRTSRMLRYYIAAQDMHERISSAHVDYRDLAEKLKNSDLIFRLWRLLEWQGQTCRNIATALHSNGEYHYDPRLERAAEGIRQSLQHYLSSRPTDGSRHPLQRLLDNLRSVNYQLAHLDSSDPAPDPHDEQTTIAAQEDPPLKQLIPTLRRHLTLDSPAYRHAIRLTLVVLTCCTIASVLQLELGYWILLTAAFVCQPNYNATKTRVNQRVLGTILGVLAGSLAPWFTPTIATKLWLIVISTALFFYFRNRKYSFSTFFITIQAFTSFSLAGFDLAAAIPLRIIDTLIGTAIAWTAVSYLWPDWRYLTLNNTARAAIRSNAAYLRNILNQLQQGGGDTLAYRSIRRQTHEHAAQLGGTVSEISSEPQKYKTQLDSAFTLLNLNYSLIAYISALGAYRAQMEKRNDAFLNAYYPLGERIADLLEALDHLPEEEFRPRLQTLRSDLNLLRPNEDDPDLQHSILWQQMLMIIRTLEPCYNALHTPSIIPIENQHTEQTVSSA